MANLIRTSNNSMKITWRQSTDKSGVEKLNFTLHGPNKIIGKAAMTADQIARFIIKNSVEDK